MTDSTVVSTGSVCQSGLTDTVPVATVSCLLDWQPTSRAQTIAGYSSFFMWLLVWCNENRYFMLTDYGDYAGGYTNFDTMNILLRATIALLAFVASGIPSTAQTAEPFPTRGFCIAAPRPDELDEFLKFIREELKPRSINTLILRVDFNYQFESHPELRDSAALSKQDVHRIVTECKAAGISLIPQINLLGHQSWASTTHNLLRVYPQFDETPHVKMPANYKWPNDDGLYCKSYCPLHPDVHPIVFSLVDEVCDAFGSTAFHAGMDEVFYIGDSKCPRCNGKSKAELFAGEVTIIRDHLATKGRRLWIWGDRLLDGSITGLGMWEGSTNDTHRA